MNSFQTFPVQTPAQLSVHIRSLRKARGLTQAQLGERIGVKQARVADIESDPGAVSLQQLLQVLHALDARLLLADTQVYSTPPASSPPIAQSPGADW
jgi:HTH-type transcriptional regulator/antitoxin HipB